MVTRSRRPRRLRAWLNVVVAAGVAGVLAACDPGPASGGDVVEVDPTARVGEGVASWYSGRHSWVWDVQERAVLLVSEEDRAHWLASLPVALGEVESRPVLDVDLSTHVLVAEGSRACGADLAELFAEVVDDRPILRLAHSPEPVVCEAETALLQVWAVPHEQTAGVAPFALSTAREGVPESTSEQVGMLVGTWDARHVADLGEILSEHAGLLRTARERDALTAALQQHASDGRRPWRQIEEADMSEMVLVVVGYHRCTETTAVHVQSDRFPTLLWVQVSGDPSTRCVHAPLTMDIWAIPADESRLGRGFELGQYRLEGIG